jgi:hypothetical protein
MRAGRRWPGARAGQYQDSRQGRNQGSPGRVFRSGKISGPAEKIRNPTFGGMGLMVQPLEE